MAAAEATETSRSKARSDRYWALLAWLFLFTTLIVGDLGSLYNDFDTYRLVHRNIVLYETMAWVYAALSVLSLGAQLRGWRTQRSSWLGILGPVAFSVGQTVILAFDLNPSCCG